MERLLCLISGCQSRDRIEFRRRSSGRILGAESNATEPTADGGGGGMDAVPKRGWDCGRRQADAPAEINRARARPRARQPRPMRIQISSQFDTNSEASHSVMAFPVLPSRPAALPSGGLARATVPRSCGVARAGLRRTSQPRGLAGSCWERTESTGLGAARLNMMTRPIQLQDDHGLNLLCI